MINEVEVVKPHFDAEIIVDIPKDIPAIKHNLKELEEFAKGLKNFYSNLVFSDENVDEAAKEKTKLNKLIKNVSSIRKEKIEEYKKPIDDFEQTAKNIEALLKSAVDDVQVFIDKSENARKEEKKKQIIEPILNSLISDAFVKGYLIDKNKIEEDKRWYNKTFKADDIEADIANQINELIRFEDELNQGLEVIKQTAEMSGVVNTDKYMERFKFTRDLTGVLNDIKNDNLKTVSGKLNNFNEVATNIVNSSMFDVPKVDNSINAIVQATFKGTEEQINKLRTYAISLGMEEI